MKILGVTIRSWNATFIIVAGTGTLCYLAITSGQAHDVNLLVSTALGFFFGKAAGEQESRNQQKPQ